METPESSSVFNLTSQQPWSKNCQMANLQKFVGQQVIHSEFVQILGDLDNGEWKKTPTKRPVSRWLNFYRATFLQQGCQTCLRCAQPNSSRYKLQLEIETITTVIRLIAENFSNFEKNSRSLRKTFLAAFSEPKSTCLRVILRKVCFWSKNLVLKVSRV